MYPVTAIGRILTCFSAFVGVATSGMLVSVLVDRYQRIYNRKRFFPEQIMTALDSSDNEHDEKQDFINRKLTLSKKNLSGGLNLPLPTTVPPLLSSNNNTKYSGYNSSSSYVRFIITIADNQTDKKLIHENANQLMMQLTDIAKSTGDQIYFKLISAETDSENNQTSTTNQLPPISEE
jgi:hypothetical protein